LQATDNGEALAYSDDPSALLAAAVADSGLTWRELALRWHVAIGDGEPCETAQQAALACYRSGEMGGGLALVRQLMRPGVVVLRDTQGRSLHALLVGLGESHAVLQVGTQRFGLTLQALATVWRGDFHTLWKTPPGWREGRPALAEASTRSWLLAQLQAPAETGAAALSEKLRIYQLTHGLQADGQLGPLTLMQMNRAAGVDEPRLPVVVVR
jgi:general secretion pathway protein A